MKIAILTPSRGRPDGFLRLVETSIKTSSRHHQIEHHCYLDWDDASVPQYLASLGKQPQLLTCFPSSQRTAVRIKKLERHSKQCA